MDSRIGWFRSPPSGLSALAAAGSATTCGAGFGVTGFRRRLMSETQFERNVASPLRRQGPSNAARRENSRMQWFEEQVERRKNSGAILRSGVGVRRPVWRGSSVSLDAAVVEDRDSQAELFRNQSAEVADLIADLTRGARLDHLLSPTKREEEPREEQPRVERREERRPRPSRSTEPSARRGSLPRHPQAKVAERLESRRRGSTVGLEGVPPPPVLDIPMVNVDIQGSKGVEKVAMVDIGTLRSRCERLEKGVRAKDLLELRKMQEREEQLRVAEKPKSLMSSSMPVLPSLASRSN